MLHSLARSNILPERAISVSGSIEHGFRWRINGSDLVVFSTIPYPSSVAWGPPPEQQRAHLDSSNDFRHDSIY